MKRCVIEMHLAEVSIAYGMTETSPVSCPTLADDDLDRRTATIGRVHPHVEIKIAVIALMDALKIDQAVLGGFDWGVPDRRSNTSTTTDMSTPRRRNSLLRSTIGSSSTTVCGGTPRSGCSVPAPSSSHSDRLPEPS
jgi:hypothetical protein